MADFKGTFYSAEILERTDLHPTEKLVLGYVLSFGDNFFASNAHIAKRLGLTERSVRGALVSLKKKGFPTPIRKNTPTQYGNTTCRSKGNNLPFKRHIDIREIKEESKSRDISKTCPLNGRSTATDLGITFGRFHGSAHIVADGEDPPF